MSQSNFTEHEWEICIKVLTALKDDPMRNPDNLTFKTLIKKIYKKARKIEHQQALQEREKDNERLATERPGFVKRMSNYFGF
ncbi:MAG: hypothetical protein LUH10_11905 [Tannerellaceae bacterium]|nr:hypothetical protein [Tannerellaceae bacterium]